MQRANGTLDGPLLDRILYLLEETPAILDRVEAACRESAALIARCRAALDDWPAPRRGPPAPVA
jgi:hypothetical protein